MKLFCGSVNNVDGTVAGVDYTAAVNPAANVSFTYDPVYPRLAMTADGIGTTAHTYHPVGGLGALRLATVNGPLAGTSDTARYTYDALGRTKTRNIGTGTTENLVTWNFDTLGRLDDTLSPLGAVDYVYVAQTGRLDRVNLPNGARTQFGYFGASGDHRLQQIKHLAVAATPSSIVSQHDYTYDAEGQIATWARVLGATSSTFALGYDNAGQLASATLTGPSGTIDRHAYTYDKAGNRRSSQRNLALTQWAANNRNQLTTQSGGGKLRVAGHLSEPAKVTVNGTKATVNAANQYEAFVDATPGANTLAVTATDYAPTPNTRTTSWSVTVTGGTAATFAYDLNGNMTSDGTRTFAWDSENRLKSVTVGASVWSWDYDGMNRRIRERLNGTVQKQWVWCGIERCEERDAAGAVTRKLYPAGEQQGGVSLFYTRDHLGSIRELLDSTATVRARYDYTPYGERTKLAGDLDTDVGYTSHQTHTGSALTLAPFRAYDALLGRWISPDPIGEAGGINLYAYVGNSPVGRWDPLGLIDYETFTGGWEESNIRLFPDKSNVYDVGAHGAPWGLYTNTGKGPFSAEQVYNRVKDDPKFKKADCTKFWACNAGFGKNSFAEQFAKLSGKPTEGATGYLKAANKEGDTGRFSRYEGNKFNLFKPSTWSKGGWRTFKP